MTVLITIGVLVILLALCVLPHEFGHFYSAKKFGVKIHEFSFGMGPILFYIYKKRFHFSPFKKIDYKEFDSTIYSMRLIPVGGFCSMKGEANGTDIDDFACLKRWKKLIVFISGPAINVFLGFFSMLLISAVFAPNIPSLQVSNIENSKGIYYNGFLPGDVVVKVNGDTVKDVNDLSYKLIFVKSDNADFVVEREGEGNQKQLVELKNVKLPTVNADGMTVPIFDLKFVETQKTPASVMAYSASSTVSMIDVTYSSIFALITNKIPASSMTSFVGIGKTVSQNVNLGFYGFFMLFSLISINLGVVNLLPIPALDGGYSAFTLIEMVRRKELNRAVINVSAKICFVLLMGLMIAVTIKDIVKLFI